MKSSTSPSSRGSRQKKKQPGYRVWHFALAVPAIAITLQVMLGSLTPLPQEHNPYLNHYASATHSFNNYEYGEYLRNEYRSDPLPEIEILPLNLRGEMTGPVLASVLKDYFPEATTEHAADLRDTLPPCSDPRMIVIVPKAEEEPVF